MKFRSRLVNFLSSLSLFVYVIHENIIFRRVYRPILWQYIHDYLGYAHLFLWVLLFVLFLFVFSSIIAVVYKFTLQKLVRFFTDKLYACLIILFTPCKKAFQNRFLKQSNNTKKKIACEMTLQPAPFEKIKEKTKTIEMRLYDEKRKTLRAGDYVRFTNVENDEKLVCQVIALHPFANFEQLYKRFEKTALGYAVHETASPDDMLAYYKQDDVLRCGVLGIEIERVE